MTTQLWIGVALAALVILFLMVAFFAKQQLDEGRMRIIRFLCSLCAAFSGGLIVGEAFFSMQTSGPTKITVYGTAGFALFFVVWYGFGKFVAPDAFAFSIPKDCTFEHAAEAIAQQDGALVDFDGFTAAELAEPLKPTQLQVDSPLEALKHLGKLAKPNSLRRYDVRYERPTYLFQVIT